MKKLLLIVLLVAFIITITGLQIEALNRGFESSFQMIYSDIKYGRDGRPGRQNDREESIEKTEKAVNRQYDFKNSEYIDVEPHHPDIKNISKIVATYDYVYYEAKSGTVKIHIKAYDMSGNEINSIFRKEMFEMTTPDVVQKIITHTYDYSYENLIFCDEVTEISYKDGHKEVISVE